MPPVVDTSDKCTICHLNDVPALIKFSHHCPRPVCIWPPVRKCFLLSPNLNRKRQERRGLLHPQAPRCLPRVSTVIALFPPGLEPTGVLTFIASMWVCRNTGQDFTVFPTKRTVFSRLKCIFSLTKGKTQPLFPLLVLFYNCFSMIAFYSIFSSRKLKSPTIKTEKPKMAQQTATKVINQPSSIEKLGMGQVLIIDRETMFFSSVSLLLWCIENDECLN